MTDALGEVLPAVLQEPRIVTLTQNVPGSAAPTRLQDFGASIVKVELPGGDPLASSTPTWYGTLSETAFFAEPLRYGITKPGAHLGGGFPGYDLYEARDDWIAIATLEAHFWERLLLELDLEDATREDLEEAFVQKTAKEWEQWAKERDLPLATSRDVLQKKEEIR